MYCASEATALWRYRSLLLLLLLLPLPNVVVIGQTVERNYGDSPEKK